MELHTTAMTRALAGILMFVLAPSPSQNQTPVGNMVLEIPELQIQVGPDDSKVLSSDRISYFQIHIPGRGINSGTVHARINAESANMIMTMTGTADGILCNFDLKRRGGFEIKPGRNSVEIEYTDHYLRVHYASYLLIVPGEAAEAVIPRRTRPLASAGTTYAVVVGISKYLHAGAGLQNLKYADRDAQAFLDFLKSPAGGGVRKENVRVLLNEDATVENLRTAFYTFLAQASDRDTVVIFLAGHGD